MDAWRQFVASSWFCALLFKHKSDKTPMKLMRMGDTLVPAWLQIEARVWFAVCNVVMRIRKHAINLCAQASQAPVSNNVLHSSSLKCTKIYWATGFVFSLRKRFFNVFFIFCVVAVATCLLGGRRERELTHLGAAEINREAACNTRAFCL